jgi:hypothetical protein
MWTQTHFGLDREDPASLSFFVFFHRKPMALSRGRFRCTGDKEDESGYGAGLCE